MSRSQFKISVVVPLYNKAPFIEEALESIFLQTLPAHEIIVVDDGSTDDGVARVESFVHRGIRLIRENNAGVSVARNAGIEAATGDFIAFLDADDRYLPGFLACVAALAGDFPKASLFGTAYRRFPAAEPSACDLPGPPLKIGRGTIEDFYSAWCRSSFFNTSSLTIRASALCESGIRFPVGERLGEDQDVWFRLAERYAIAFDPEVHSEYRTGVIGSATDSVPVLDMLPCFGRLSSRLGRDEVPAPLVRGARRLLASHLLNIARARLSLGNRQGAWELVLNPIARANPSYLIRTGLLIGISTVGLGVLK